jgi:hypothetical protein
VLLIMIIRKEAEKGIPNRSWRHDSLVISSLSAIDSAGNWL